MGQFGLMKDKRLPYEFDVHVPAYVRGPGVTAGSVVEDAVINVDLFPTFLEIAGLISASAGNPLSCDEPCHNPQFRLSCISSHLFCNHE